MRDQFVATGEFDMRSDAEHLAELRDCWSFARQVQASSVPGNTRKPSHRLPTSIRGAEGELHSSASHVLMRAL